MKKVILIIAVLMVSILTVEAQEKKIDKKQERKEKAEQAYKQTKALIESGEFVFDAVWAFPQNGTRVDITGNNNRLEFRENITKGSLQFFGTAYTSRRSTFNQGIVMDGPVKEWQVLPNDRGHQVTVRFNTKKKREVYDVDISVAANGYAVVVVSSSLRDLMRYEGYVSMIEEN